MAERVWVVSCEMDWRSAQLETTAQCTCFTTAYMVPIHGRYFYKEQMAVED